MGVSAQGSALERWSVYGGNTHSRWGREIGSQGLGGGVGVVTSHGYSGGDLRKRGNGVLEDIQK